MDGSGLSDGPEVRHVVVGLLAIVLEFDNLLVDVVVAFGSDEGNLTLALRRNHDVVLREEIVLLAVTVDVTTDEGRTNLHGRDEEPELRAVERRHVNTSGDEHTCGLSRNRLQRTLDTVENFSQDTRAQLHGQRFLRSHDWITNGQAIYF